MQEIITQARLRPLYFRYEADFLENSVADAMFMRLERDTRWQEETIAMFGRKVRVPRGVSWYGQEGLSYRYSGQDHVAHGWPRYLAALCEDVAEELAEQPNFVLLNRYYDGRDYMGWHTDDEATMGSRLASLSLGATRRFLLQESPTTPRIQLELAHGSLLIMSGGLRHALPRTSRRVGTRINLTFRTLADE